MSLVFATRSDLTPRQGATVDALPDDWRIIGRIDSNVATMMDMTPDPYPSPPTLILVRDPTGVNWQIDREGNLDRAHFKRRSHREHQPMQPMRHQLANAA